MREKSTIPVLGMDVRTLTDPENVTLYPSSLNFITTGKPERPAICRSVPEMTDILSYLIPLFTIALPYGLLYLLVFVLNVLLLLLHALYPYLSKLLLFLQITDKL